MTAKPCELEAGCTGHELMAWADDPRPRRAAVSPESPVSKAALQFGFAEARCPDFAHQQAIKEKDWVAAGKAADDQCWGVAERAHALER